MFLHALSRPGEPSCEVGLLKILSVEKGTIGEDPYLPLTPEHPGPPPSPRLALFPGPPSHGFPGAFSLGQTQVTGFRQKLSHLRLAFPSPVLVLAGVLCLLSRSCPPPTMVVGLTCLDLLRAAMGLR